MRYRSFLVLALPFFLALEVGELTAQVGAPNPDENPEGNTGALKAQIDTGGSYDAHSGNGTRIVNDLHCPGALGVYGLDFTRYWNSLPNDRDNEFATPPTDFGTSGWSHSWAWNAVYGEEGPEQGAEGGGEEGLLFWTTSITITFPDGHANKYKIVRSDAPINGDPQGFGPPYYLPREKNWNEPGSGLHDHLGDMTATGSSFWLYRADGGAVHFEGISADWSSGHAWWYYHATEIFDPYGLRTVLRYKANNGPLEEVTQDGGRSLTIRWDYYAGFAQPVIGRVEVGGIGGLQGVDYGYSPNGIFLNLTAVTYPEGAATYTYGNYYGEDPNSGNYSNFPLLKTADDPRFAGPMTKIRYNYRGGACPSPSPSPAPHNPVYFRARAEAIANEKNSLTGVIVSRFTIDCVAGTRTEYNGLGGSRKFFFGISAGPLGSFFDPGYKLAKLTDFTTTDSFDGVPFQSQNYDNKAEPRQVWDGRDIQTELIATSGDDSGEPGEIHHVGADGSVRLYDRVNPGNSDACDAAFIHNPYNHWLFSKTDERGKTTVYKRDSRRRIILISYYDGPAQGSPVSTEEYTYNSFNQVLTHTLPSGAVQHYDYNALNQLQQEWNSVDGESAATTYTYYGPGSPAEWTGLVATAHNARAGTAPYSTMMEYNGRFQVTKVHYPPTGVNSDPYVEYVYDDRGNCIEVWNELRQKSSYTYDSYRRCTSYTEPLNALDWTGSSTVASRTWDWIYDRDSPETGLRDASSHTKNEWRVQIEPAFNGAGERKMTARWHDVENRITMEQTGWIQRPTYIGDWYWSSDGETHSFSYDENGQKKSYTDPRGRLTTYDYDLRNRLWKTNENPIAGQIPSDTRTTETLYDFTGNKTLVKFPIESTGQRTQQWLDYDAFGQAWRFIDERNNTTNLTYQWGPMKKLDTVTTHRQRDSVGGGTEDQFTNFEYDLTGRPQWTIFPDGSSELTTYLYGQVDAFKTRKNQTKRVHYDVRGRESYHTWDSDAAPRIDRSWDDAHRLTSISNIWSSIDYAYGAAGQVIWEGNEIAGSGGRTQTNYYRYGDGSVAHLHYPGGAYLRKDYTSRGQLAAVGWDDDTNAWWMKLAAYTYLPDGKVDNVNYGNGMTSDPGYDGRGFVSSVQHKRTASGDLLSSRTYTRDTRDRITSFVKNGNASLNPMENGRGDRFAYDNEGQVTDAWYNALDPAGNFNNWTRRDHFDYDALGNRQGDYNYLAGRNGGSTPVKFTRRDNGLNQYIHWWPAGLDYIIYHDDNYWNAPGNGVTMTDGWLVASYNALNQPVAMVPYGWADALYFGYDPLGRCVKRWRGTSGDVYSNPATYFHYDGWNLLQEGDNAWGPARVYVHGNRVDEIVWSYKSFTGEQAFHHYDARGHCTLLTDSSGNILEQYEYDAFGQPYFYDGSGNSIGAYDAQGLWAGYSLFGNRFLFTGREWLSDVKLYDYRNRMYQPELGRFLQPDPKQFGAGDYNLYRYCHNDPVNRRDPSGLISFSGNVEKQHLVSVIGSNIKQWVTFERIPISFTTSGNAFDTNAAHHVVDAASPYLSGNKGNTIITGSVREGHNSSGAKMFTANANVDYYTRAERYDTLERQHAFGVVGGGSNTKGFFEPGGHWDQFRKDWANGITDFFAQSRLEQSLYSHIADTNREHHGTWDNPINGDHRVPW